MKEHSEFQFENEIPWKDVGNGVSRQLYGHDENIMMVKVKFEKGARGEAHKHPHVQVTYVASGEFEMNIGGIIRLLKAGDGYFVPPDTIHSCLCLEEGMLVDVFNPARVDLAGG